MLRIYFLSPLSYCHHSFNSKYVWHISHNYHTDILIFTDKTFGFINNKKRHQCCLTLNNPKWLHSNTHRMFVLPFKHTLFRQINSRVCAPSTGYQSVFLYPVVSPVLLLPLSNPLCVMLFLFSFLLLLTRLGGCKSQMDSLTCLLATTLFPLVLNHFPPVGSEDRF